MPEPRFEVAQICRNGHLITDCCKSRPNERANFCPDCGAPTIDSCEKCNSPIRGRSVWSNSFNGRDDLGPEIDRIPAYCHGCGVGYPWTRAQIEAARALAEEFHELSATEKQELADGLENIAVDSPMTQVAVSRLKRIGKKLARESYNAFKEVGLKIGTEWAKRELFGP